MSALTDAAHSVHSPPPCGEGLGVGVVRFFHRWRHRTLTASPPSPTLPHNGGTTRPTPPPPPSPPSPPRVRGAALPPPTSLPPAPVHAPPFTRQQPTRRSARRLSPNVR